MDRKLAEATPRQNHRVHRGAQRKNLKKPLAVGKWPKQEGKRSDYKDKKIVFATEDA
jgi:hypothetical protein